MKSPDLHTEVIYIKSGKLLDIKIRMHWMPIRVYETFTSIFFFILKNTTKIFLI